jgi:uncharacterized protein with HEPN domain
MTDGKTFSDFEDDLVLRLAVERALEIIGEAARKVSNEFQQSHLEIPWRDITGQRNILAHEYGDVDPGRLWQTVETDNLALVSAVDAIIPR